MADDRALRDRPVQYLCPSCRLLLITWDPPTNHVEMFHKVALWSDFGTGDVRIVCQYCLGATEIVPDRLVKLLRERFGLYAPPRESRRPGQGGGASA